MMVYRCLLQIPAQDGHLLCHHHHGVLSAQRRSLHFIHARRTLIRNHGPRKQTIQVTSTDSQRRQNTNSTPAEERARQALLERFGRAGDQAQVSGAQPIRNSNIRGFKGVRSVRYQVPDSAQPQRAHNRLRQWTNPDHAESPRPGREIPPPLQPPRIYQRARPVHEEDHGIEGKTEIPSSWQHLRKPRKQVDVSQLLANAETRSRTQSDVSQLLAGAETRPYQDRARKPYSHGSLDDLLKGERQPEVAYTGFLRKKSRNLDQVALSDAERRNKNRPSDPEEIVDFTPRARSFGDDKWVRRVVSADATSASQRSVEDDDLEAPEKKIQIKTAWQVAEEEKALEYERRRSRKRTNRTVSEADQEAWRSDSRNTRRQRRETDDDDLRMESRQERKAKRKASSKDKPTPISLPEYISVANLATALHVNLDRFVRKLDELGYEDVQTYHILGSEDASLIASEYNFVPTIEQGGTEVDILPLPVPDDVSALPPRPPVVTIMGHVDHGKTTLLDYLRKSAVVDSEFGGITQHIGAFSVPLPSGKTITFLDTPGHAAFLSMRQRGANVTDIVVLVVAADDSVKPQTIEAIKHAQGARVPIIVAINKIDKHGADPESVKRDLMANGVEVEDLGGDVQAIPVSGKTGEGMEELEEAITTLSEILDHRADPEGPVEGWVLEASTKEAGRVATVLVRRGTLRVGDILVAGTTWTRVRTLKNEAGALLPEVGPGIPAEIDGWREQPEAGDEALQAPDEQRARDAVDYRTDLDDRAKLSKDMDAINETRRVEAEKRAALKEAARIAADEGINEEEAPAEKAKPEDAPVGMITVPFIIKADVSGSAEAIVDSISAIGNGEIQTQILRSGVGAVSEFDVEHAAAARGHVINFNTTTPSSVASLAEERGVKIMNHNIIYRLVDEIKEMLTNKLPPRILQRVVGEAEILQTFNFNVHGRKYVLVAGCRVRNGVVKKSGLVRVMRDREVVHTGTITSLKNVRKDVQEMSRGSECGMSFGGWEDFLPGDTIQHYVETKEKRTL